MRLVDLGNFRRLARFCFKTVVYSQNLVALYHTCKCAGCPDMLRAFYGLDELKGMSAVLFFSRLHYSPLVDQKAVQQRVDNKVV